MAEELLQRVHGRAGIGVALREAVPERVRNDQLSGEGDRVAGGVSLGSVETG